jgi:hypothetical protein
MLRSEKERPAKLFWRDAAGSPATGREDWRRRPRKATFLTVLSATFPAALVTKNSTALARPLFWKKALPHDKKTDWNRDPAVISGSDILKERGLCPGKLDG